MAGMRDVLIHEYLWVKPGAIWETVKVDLPNIKVSIKRVLDELR